MNLRQRSARTLGALTIITAIVACADSAGPKAAGGDAAQLVGATGRTDSAKPKPDTTKPKPDSGTPKPDTGRPPVDSGRPPVDTGRPPVDTGRPPVDTGRPPVDTGRPPVDTSHTAIIAGDVFGVDSTKQPATFGPLSRVVVTVFHPVFVPGTGGDSGSVRYDSVAAARTGELGRFEFTGLLAGSYLVRAVPPSGSGYPTVQVPTFAYSVNSLVLRVPLRIYLHKGP